MSMEVGGKGVKSDINVTPLVDVVLVLLIIFMVITPMLQRGKPVVLPDARHVSALTRGGEPIMISVTRDGRVWIDQDEVKKDELPAMLQVQMEMHRGAPILLKGDRELDYKVIREVVLELSKTHLIGVSLAASQIKDKGSK